MKENIVTEKEETISIFVPIAIRRRGGSAMIIMPKNIKKEEMLKCFDGKIIKALAKAYKWRVMLEDNEISSLAEISRKEKVTGAYVSRVFNLNFIAPEIVKRILEGTQPRDLKLKDMIIGKVPDSWQEQKEMWGF